MKKLLPILVLAAALAGCNNSEGGSTAASGGGGAGDAGGAKEYTFALNVKEGDTVKYKTEITGGGQKVEIVISDKYAKVADDKITVHQKVESMSLNGNAIPAPQADIMKKMTVVMEKDKFGNVQKTSVENAPPGSGPISSGASSLQLPEKAVKVGDTWDGQVEINNKKVDAKYKLVKVANEGGKEIAYLEATTGEIEGVKLTGPITYKLDVATGVMEEMKLSLEAGSDKGTVSMTRI